KQSSLERGASEERAKEIAARTVNKQRREDGETPQQSTQGTGNPNVPLEDRSKEELYNIAKGMDIKGRSKMRKRELVSAIRERRDLFPGPLCVFRVYEVSRKSSAEA